MNLNQPVHNIIIKLLSKYYQFTTVFQNEKIDHQKKLFFMSSILNYLTNIGLYFKI